VPLWIELLDDERDVARDALQSLRGLSRRALDRDPVAWRSWLARDLAAWRSAEARAADLHSPDASKAAAELQALGRVRLYRHDAAAIAIAGLERREPELVRLTCQVIAELGSPVGEPALRAMADHPDASVRATAERALERLAQRSRPGTP